MNDALNFCKIDQTKTVIMIQKTCAALIAQIETKNANSYVFTLRRLFEKLTTSQIFFHDIVEFNNLFFLRRQIALNKILKIDFVTLTRA